MTKSLRIAMAAFLGLALQLVAAVAWAKTDPGNVFREPGVINFCTQLAQPPASFTEADGVTPTGFEVDIMYALAREMGLRAAITNLNYSAIAAALDAGKCDAVIASTSVTPERLKKYRFVEYIRASSALLVPQGNPLKLHDYDDLSGRRVAVLLGTVNERRLEAASAELVAKGKRPIRIATYQSTPIAFNELDLGRADAFASGSLTLAYYLTRSKGKYELGGLPVAAATYGIMLPQAEEAKADAIGRAYAALYRDGTLTKIVHKWGGEKGVTLCDGKCVVDLANEESVRPAIVGLTHAQVAPVQSKNVHFDVPFFLQFVFFPSPVLLAGLGITLAAAGVSMLLGSTIGALLALCAISQHRPLRWANQVYITFFRGTPVLVQLVLVYFGLPVLLGGIDLFPPTISFLGIGLSGALVAGVATFSLHEAAFASEIFRAGIQSIDKGQTEAAQSLGMSPSLTMRRIVLPQALRVILPPLANQCNLMLKTTSLLSVIAIPEMFHVADAIQSATYKTFEVYLGISVYYLAMTGLVTLGQRRIERHFRHEGRARRPASPSGGLGDD